MESKDCPMCGGTMKLHTREAVTRVPGVSTPRVKSTREWRCPDCDYFEDAEES